MIPKSGLFNLLPFPARRAGLWKPSLSIVIDFAEGAFIPAKAKHQVLDDLGVWTRESLITVQPDGKAYIPVQNFQGLTIKLDEGVQLGVVSLCDVPRQDEPVNETEPKQGKSNPPGNTCASVKAFINSPERYKRLQNMLDFPDDLSSF